MPKNINIRIEKQPEKYKGPRLVNIDNKLVDMRVRQLQKLISAGNVSGIIMIIQCRDNHHKTFTTLCNERTAYELDRVSALYKQ